ncbi:MAG: hypothetical protein ABSB23_04300 [Bryobacteraceae bacterium]|jgi:hypothetical protein
MASLPKYRIPMRAERLRLETPERLAEGLLQPVRYPGVPVSITPNWPD